MNARENAISCLERQPYERVPTFLFDTSLCSAVTGISMAEIFGNNGYNPELAAKAVIGSRKFIGHDMTMGALKSMDYRVFGAEMRYSDNAPMMTVKRAFGDPEELFKHEPEEIDSPSIHAYAEGFSVIRKTDKEATLGGTVPAPFSVGCMLRGLEPMLVDAVAEKEYTEKLLKFTMKVGDIVGDIFLREGNPDFGVITGAFDNPDILSLEDIRTLCLPGIEKHLRMIKEYGIPSVYHPHGQFTKEPGINLVDDYRKMSIDCLYYGENNAHSAMREISKGDFSLMGGIDTFTTIYLGDSNRIISDTEDVLKPMEDFPFVFTCSCSVDGDLDIHKMKLMIDTVSNRNKSKINHLS